MAENQSDSQKPELLPADLWFGYFGQDFDQATRHYVLLDCIIEFYNQGEFKIDADRVTLSESNQQLLLAAIDYISKGNRRSFEFSLKVSEFRSSLGSPPTSAGATSLHTHLRSAVHSINPPRTELDMRTGRVTDATDHLLRELLLLTAIGCYNRVKWVVEQTDAGYKPDVAIGSDIAKAIGNDIAKAIGNAPSHLPARQAVKLHLDDAMPLPENISVLLDQLAQIGDNPSSILVTFKELDYQPGFDVLASSDDEMLEFWGKLGSTASLTGDPIADADSVVESWSDGDVSTLIELAGLIFNVCCPDAPDKISDAFNSIPTAKSQMVAALEILDHTGQLAAASAQHEWYKLGESERLGYLIHQGTFYWYAHRHLSEWSNGKEKLKPLETLERLLKSLEILRYAARNDRSFYVEFEGKKAYFQLLPGSGRLFRMVKSEGSIRFPLRPLETRETQRHQPSDNHPFPTIA